MAMDIMNHTKKNGMNGLVEKYEHFAQELQEALLENKKAMEKLKKAAEQALEDLRKVDLPDNPLLLCYRVRAHQSAARAYGPNDPRREQAWSQAARDVERLARHRDNRMAVQERCYYYSVRGEDDALLAAGRQARQDRVEDYFVTEMEAGVLFGRTNPVMVQGLVLAGIPVMHRLSPDPFTVFQTGDRVRMSPKRGMVELIKRVA